MKGILLIPILFFVACSLLPKPMIKDKQCKSKYDQTLKMVIYNFVDEMPEYQGGHEELIRFIAKHIKYPKQDVFQGAINCSFVIDKSGYLIDLKIYNKDINDYTALEIEMLRVLKLMPKWRVGRCANRKVPVRMMLPIKL